MRFKKSLGWPDVKATIDSWKAVQPSGDPEDDECRPDDKTFATLYLFVGLCIEKPSRYFDIPVPDIVGTSTVNGAFIWWQFKAEYFWESLSFEFNRYGDLLAWGRARTLTGTPADNWFYELDVDEEPGVNQETIERMLASLPMSFAEVAECTTADGLAAQD